MWYAVLTSDELGGYGSLASIFGLVVSLFVLRDVRKVRAAFLFKARVPQLVQEIGDICTELIELEDFRQATRLVSKINAKLTSLKRHVPRSLEKDLEATLKTIETARIANKESINKVYQSTQYTLEQVKEFVADKEMASWR